MAQYGSPRKAGARNSQPLKKLDVQQSSRKNRIVWQSEIAGRIVPISNSMEDFLEHFVPGDKPRQPVMKSHFDFPSDAKAEDDLYEPLCDGLRSLVSRFDKDKRLTFINHNHDRIKFPYALCASEHHITRPDVVASLPGKTSVGSHPDYWRDISLVAEVKLEESEDPMKSYSQEHENTLIQLSKSARNLLVSQSRLFVFVIGVYGRLARIFRFDHGGAVCSRAFDYTTLQGSRQFHEFLYRFTHPLLEKCNVVGADPTVVLVSPEEGADIAQRLRDVGVDHEDSDEAKKAYRYVTLSLSERSEKTYLAYDLVFINPHLFSRATTVWEAIEVDSERMPTGRPVIIKDSWRQLVRQLESDNYKDIFSSAKDGIDLAGVAKFLGGEDLGADEIRALENGEPGGGGVGHLTVTARHCVNGTHAYNERSHARLVLGTVGIPLSRFKSTREMVEALRDAIEGHRKLFEGGIMHRDISEGNVMISRDPDAPFIGYIQDLDYGMNWRKLLEKLGYEPEREDWHSFVKEESAKILKKFEAEQLAKYFKKNASKPVTKRQAGANSGDDIRRSALTSEAHHRDSSPVAKPRATQPDDPRSLKQSLGTLDDPVNDFGDEADDAPGGVQVSRHDGTKVAVSRPPSADEVKLQCKQRTGTLYFMAVEIIEGDVVHEVRHDLESFFWLLVWLVLRYTEHDQGPRGCAEVFDGDTDMACREKKAGYLTRMVGALVPGNGPLCILLENLRFMCSRNHRHHGFTAPEPLTYDAVLGVFDRVLSMEWPEDDKALPYVLAVDNEEISPGPGESRQRHESTIDSSQIKSEDQDGRGSSHADPSGQSRRARTWTRAVQRSGGDAVATSGSARKRSHDERDASEKDCRPVRSSKRTRTSSEHQAQSASGRKGPCAGR